MTWTAKVVRTTPVGSQFESSVLFQNDTDETQNFQQSFLYDGSQSSLEDLCRNRINGPSVDTPVEETILDIAPVLTITPLPVQTPSQQNQGSWLAAYQRVIRLQRGLAAGLTAITPKNITDAQAILNSIPYDSSYEVSL